MRGVMNRFWFTKLFIRNLEITGSEIADPMAAVLADDVPERLEVEAEEAQTDHDWDQFMAEIQNHDPLEGRGSHVSRLVDLAGRLLNHADQARQLGVVGDA